MERYDYFEDMHSGYEPEDSGHTPTAGGGTTPPEPPKKKGGKGRKVAKGALALCLTAGIAGGAFGIGTKYGTNQATSQMSETVAQLETNYSEALASLNTALEEVKSSTSSDSGYVKTSTASGVTSSATGIFRQVANSVVSITSTVEQQFFYQVYDSTGAGSGIIFNEDDEKVYIVTNYHVVNGSKAVTISLDDETQFTANYVGGDESYDIAVISVNKNDLVNAGVTYEIATFGDSSIVEIGDTAMAVGNALGEGKSAALGIVSATSDDYEVSTGVIIKVIRTDAAINPGNSGGALVNADGEVIGINTAKLASSEVEGMGYAIPSNTVIEIINEIMENGSIETPWLGIRPVEVTDRIKQSYGFASLGIYVQSVESNSTAECIGLRQGDIITSFNGVTIETADELTAAIQNTTVGDTISLTVLRNNTEITLNGTMQKYVGATNF